MTHVLGLLAFVGILNLIYPFSQCFQNGLVLRVFEVVEFADPTVIAGQRNSIITCNFCRITSYYVVDSWTGKLFKKAHDSDFLLFGVVSSIQPFGKIFAQDFDNCDTFWKNVAHLVASEPSKGVPMNTRPLVVSESFPLSSDPVEDA